MYSFGKVYAEGEHVEMMVSDDIQVVQGSLGSGKSQPSQQGHLKEQIVRYSEGIANLYFFKKSSQSFICRTSFVRPVWSYLTPHQYPPMTYLATVAHGSQPLGSRPWWPLVRTGQTIHVHPLVRPSEPQPV